jgi:hypothetical protein
MRSGKANEKRVEAWKRELQYTAISLVELGFHKRSTKS